MKKLNYQAEIEGIGCDLTDFVQQNRICYRWTFDRIEHPNNFLPRYLLKPEMTRENCIGWGLSLFETLEQAENRLYEIAQNRKRIYKAIGTHVAEGRLTENEGISDKAQRNGHFTLFEYAEIDLQNNFKIIAQIYE